MTIPITPSGTWKKSPEVERPSKINKAPPKRTYEEYIVAECLVKKASVEDCPEAKPYFMDGDEVWYYDDNKTPLAGSAGYVLVRNGAGVWSHAELMY